MYMYRHLHYSPVFLCGWQIRQVFSAVKICVTLNLHNLHCSVCDENGLLVYRSLKNKDGMPVEQTLLPCIVNSRSSGWETYSVFLHMLILDLRYH